MERNNGADFTRAKQRDYDDILIEDILLASARTKPEELGLAGTRLYMCLDAYSDKFTKSSTLTAGTLLVSLNEPQGNPVEMRAGIFYDFKVPFDRIFIRNSAQTGKGARLISSTDALINPFSSEVIVTGTIGGTFTDVADVSILTTATTLVAAANATRKSATFSNLLANGTVVRIGTSAAGAARGNEIPVGGSAKIEHTGAVYIYNPSVATINIAVTETST